MKYGKEFQQILDDPSLPSDWKTSAIEYRRLKKLIKDVVSELSGMGLSPDVLHKLLVTEGHTAVPDKSGDEESSGNEKENGDEGDILEFEFESPESSPPSMARRASVPVNEPLEVVLDPVRNEDTVAGALSDTNQPHHKTFRLRLLSETQPEKPVLKPMGVMDMVKSRTEPKRRASESHAMHGSLEKQKRGRRVVRRAVADHGGVKAKYVLVGSSANPTPQLRLHMSTTSSPDNRSPDRAHTSSGGFTSDSASHATTTDSEAEAMTSDSEDEEVRPPKAAQRGPASPLRTPRAFGFKSPLTLPTVDVMPPSPSLHRLKQAMSPIWALATGNNIQDGLRDLTLDSPTTPKMEYFQMPTANEGQNSAQAGYLGPHHTLSEAEPDEATQLKPPTETTEHERDFIIPLAADVAFFNLLTTALTSLSTFHAAQQELFRQSVELLCGMIRASIQPGSSPTILATPFTPTPADTPPSGSSSAVVRRPQTKSSKKDLYVWREIFTLWIEHEIFESSAERTRGERTVEQAQERLKKFANEVVKRGLGDRRTIKGKKSRGAWDEFLRLNVLLLDLKRFQMANINAARKILKKHDKRTALTASAGFPEFVRSTLANAVDQDGNINTWNFYNTSLPHVLLASLTDTLLPILPSLDDYACLICTSIAFKPIRLTCGHLFCVRCLVKMQRAGKGECPLCRSQVVLLADKDSLDVTLMRFMKDWFPKEVKEKQRDNDREIAIEQSKASGIVVTSQPGQPERCIIM